jgi:DNA primase
MHQNGFDNTVGISGKILSDEQAELMKSFAKKSILIFDDQEDTIAAAKKLRKFIPTSITVEHDKDPADMSRQEIMSLIDRRRSSLISFD